MNILEKMFMRFSLEERRKHLCNTLRERGELQALNTDELGFLTPIFRFHISSSFDSFPCVPESGTQTNPFYFPVFFRYWITSSLVDSASFKCFISGLNRYILVPSRSC